MAVVKLLTTDAEYKDRTRAGERDERLSKGSSFPLTFNGLAALRNNGTFQRFKSIHTMNELESIRTRDWIGVAVAMPDVSFASFFSAFRLGFCIQQNHNETSVCDPRQMRFVQILSRYCRRIPITVEVTYLLASQLQRTSISIKQVSGE